jgi:hypothetical protein
VPLLNHCNEGIAYAFLDRTFSSFGVLVEIFCRNPTLAKCEDETHTPKVGDLESSGTPECLGFNNKGQNTSDWGVLGVIGKFLKCRCPKWLRIGHLDICSPSYGQKKGWESNWQFDSRPQKVGNRPLPNVCRWSVMGALESSQGELQLWFRPHSNRRSEPGVVNVQSLGSLTRDSFGTPTWESREKEPFRCGSRGVTQRILYGGRWWLPPSPGRGESCVSKCPWLVPTPKGVPECELTFCGWFWMQIQAW